MLSGAVLLTAALSGPVWAGETWTKAETRHFVLYSDGDAAALRKSAETLEAFDDLFWSLYGLESPTEAEAKLKVYMVGSVGALRRVAPAMPGNVAGFYSATADETFAISIRGAGQSVLQHEYVHHLMLRHFPAVYPAWFVEGYAEYLMTAEIGGKSADVGKPDEGRRYELTNNKWLPLTDVLGDQVWAIPEAKRSTFYAQAWLLTHYFLSDPARMPQFQAYIAAISNGEASVDAMTKATGLTPQALEKALRLYYAGAAHYREIDRSKRPKPEVTITTLPPSAELMLEDLDVRTGVPDASKAAVLADIRTRAARYPGDTFAELALARVEIELGDPSAGAAILKKRLAADPRDVEALALEARRLVAAGDADKPRQQADYDEAGLLLAQAFKLDPTRYQTLFAFAETRRLEPHYPSDNALQALLVSFKQAPQVGAIRLETARALIARNKIAEATGILTPLVNDPHGGASSEAAKALLKAANETAKGDKAASGS
jgi:tetratricopeptide (TPR) repeat protein